MRLKASPAAFVGLVYAADRQSAIKTAIKQFAIRPAAAARDQAMTVDPKACLVQ
jgi:gamma-glutamylcysteine synthetase